MKFYFNIIICIGLLSVQCTQKPSTQSNSATNLPEEFQKMLTAHGGIETWRAKGSMEFDVEGEPTEHHLIDLRSRKDLITCDSFQIGFDGDQVWVAPKREAFKGKSARFYHNLIFYFAAMPFVLADDGVNYAPTDTISLNGKVYKVIQCSFQSGMGDSDQDSYKLCFDPETHQMEYLMYTSTFFSGKSHENYNLIHYQNKKEVDGLLLAQTLQWYVFKDGKIGEPRSSISVMNMRLKSESPPANLFKQPVLSEIDSMITH